MLQLASFGAPLFELAARFVVWLYMPAILCFLISLRLVKDGLLGLLRPSRLPAVARLRLALLSAFGAMQGIVLGAALTFAIYYRKEIFQWVTGLV